MCLAHCCFLITYAKVLIILHIGGSGKGREEERKGEKWKRRKASRFKSWSEEKKSWSGSECGQEPPIRMDLIDIRYKRWHII